MATLASNLRCQTLKFAVLSLMNVDLFLHALQTNNMLGLSSIIDGWDLRKYWK